MYSGICVLYEPKPAHVVSIGPANSYWKQYKASSLLFEEALKQTFEHAHTEATKQYEVQGFRAMDR